MQLKKNILDLRWKVFVQQREDIIWLDSAILMHPKTREASGHVDWFNDPLIDDKNTWERFRADKLIEDCIERDRSEIVQDLDADAVLKERYHKELGVENLIPESWTLEQMKEFMVQYVPNNPTSKKPAEWTDVRKFALMYHTFQWVIEWDTNKIRMRPETAQGIFVNFKNITDTMRLRVPFGVAQPWKAFRNEITPWNFLYRTREFEMLEIEYFVENNEEEGFKYVDHWIEESLNRWKNIMQVDPDRLRVRAHEDDELSHYSTKTVDIEFKYPWWRGELQGIAYRTDFDLKAHQEHSGQSMQYTDPMTWKRYIPHVVEPSFWLSRMFLTMMFDAYTEEEYVDSNGREQTRVVAKFPTQIAPVRAAILPVVKKDQDLVRMWRELYKELSQHFIVEYDEAWAIWKRYRRQDEIWTPYCITLDSQTKEDNTVTVRERDSMNQTRVPLSDILSSLA